MKKGIIIVILAGCVLSIISDVVFYSRYKKVKADACHMSDLIRSHLDNCGDSCGFEEEASVWLYDEGIVGNDTVDLNEYTWAY